MQHPLRSVCIVSTILACLWMALAPAPAAAQDSSNSDIVLGEVGPGDLVVTKIAIPTFESKGSTGGIDPKLFSEVIYNDLAIFSDFAPVKNQEFVNQAQAKDKNEGSIDYLQWQRLEANFVLKGSYQLDGDTIVADCRLYDVDNGQQTFGIRYSNYPIGRVRRLAHKMSDDIMERVFNQTPIAGTRILFVSKRSGVDKKEIFIMDADGHNQKRLTFDNSLTATPCWGQNMTEIYYTSYKNYNPDLVGLQLETGKTWNISLRPNLNFAADWSPRKERIALTLGKDGNSEIYTMDRSGKNNTLKRLTYVAGIDSSPSWSPAGNQIAFTSNRTGTPQIHIMNADGTNVRRLTHQGSYNDAADWSPKGDRIAFAGRDRGVFNIYTMNLEGTDWRMLTAGQGNNEDPCWAPDGDHLVFASDRTGSFNIYIMQADGSNQHRLTNTGTNNSAAWSPGTIPY